jgi:hypothetical protein
MKRIVHCQTLSLSNELRNIRALHADIIRDELSPAIHLSTIILIVMLFFSTMTSGWSGGICMGNLTIVFFHGFGLCRRASLRATIGARFRPRTPILGRGPISEPAFSLARFDRFKNNIYSTKTSSFQKLLKSLVSGERVIYTDRGEYSFTAAVSEIVEREPDIAIFVDRHSGPHPISARLAGGHPGIFGMARSASDFFGGVRVNMKALPAPMMSEASASL